MASASPDLLKPRKLPRQARSAATVEAIFEATIQVLLVEGPGRLTTTRVAERAGVSVGTMYQYFPHKQALLYAVLQQHLEAVSDAVETACLRYEGLPLEAMSDGLVAAFLDAKTSNIEAARALYLVASQLNSEVLLSDVTQRVSAAITRLLAVRRMPDSKISKPWGSPYAPLCRVRCAPFSSAAPARRHWRSFKASFPCCAAPI